MSRLKEIKNVLINIKMCDDCEICQYCIECSESLAKVILASERKMFEDLKMRYAMNISGDDMYKFFVKRIDQLLNRMED